MTRDDILIKKILQYSLHMKLFHALIWSESLLNIFKDPQRSSCQELTRGFDLHLSADWCWVLFPESCSVIGVSYLKECLFKSFARFKLGLWLLMLNFKFASFFFLNTGFIKYVVSFNASFFVISVLKFSMSHVSPSERLRIQFLFKTMTLEQHTASHTTAITVGLAGRPSMDASLLLG